MTTSERALSGIFKLSAPPREAPVIVVPRPDGKPAPAPLKKPDEHPGSSEKPLAEKLKENAVSLVIAGILIFGGLGYAISRIASANNTEPIPAEETTSKENIIQLTKSSFTPVSDEEMQNLWKNTKTVDLENYIFTMGFPFNQETIDRNPNIRRSQEFNTILPPTEKNRLEQAGVKNVNTLNGLSKGDEYKVKYDYTKFDASVILLNTAGVTETIGSSSFTPAYTSYRLILRSKEAGKISQGGIIGLYAEPLVKTNPYPKDHHPVYEDGTPISFGESILRLTTDLQDWDGKIGQPLPGQKGQFQDGVSHEQQSLYDPRVMLGIPLTTDYLRSSDGNIASQR